MNYDDIPEIEGFKKMPLGQAKDLRNEKFGKLTPLYRLDKKANCAIWVCKCDCGNITTATSNQLKLDRKKSCGCYQKEARYLRVKDLSGQKFGRLTVLRKSNKRNKSRHIYYECKCDCGNICVVNAGHLVGGRIKSCGCLHKESASNQGKKIYADLLNKRFGKLIVLEKTNERKWEQIIWKCKCDCGNIVYVPSNLLISGRTISCGCTHTSSFGEEKIKQLLENFKIVYEEQKTFESCFSLKTKRHFYYDFYINNKYLIEYDGEQHYKEIAAWGGEKGFKKRRENDIFKNQWCKDNNIPLIRIPYTAYDTLCIDDLKLETTKYRVV